MRRLRAWSTRAASRRPARARNRARSERRARSARPSPRRGRRRRRRPPPAAARRPRPRGRRRRRARRAGSAGPCAARRGSRASPSSPRAQRTTCMLASVPEPAGGALELVGDARAVTLKLPIQAPRARRGRRSGRAPRRGVSSPSQPAPIRAISAVRERPEAEPGGQHHRVAERAAEPGLGAARERVAADVGVDDEVAAEQPGSGARFPRPRPPGRR